MLPLWKLQPGFAAGVFFRVQERFEMQKSLSRYFPVFVLPTLLAFAMFFVVPFFLGIGLSFTKFTTVTRATWVGLDNYIKAFTADNEFISALGFTALFTIVSIITVNVFAFSLALLCTREMKGVTLFRSIFFMPNLIGGIVLGYIWNLMINGVLSNWAWIFPMRQNTVSGDLWSLQTGSSSVI